MTDTHIDARGDQPEDITIRVSLEQAQLMFLLFGNITGPGSATAGNDEVLKISQAIRNNQAHDVRYKLIRPLYQALRWAGIER